MPTIGAAVTDTTKCEFEAAARRRRTTASHLCASLIHEFLMLEAGAASPPSSLPVQRQVPEQAAALSPTKSKQVFVRLEPHYYTELERLAAERAWHRGTYLANLFYAHADKRPVFCSAEINALRQLARQLSEIGRNLHHVATILRIAPTQTSLVTSFEFQLLEMLIASQIIAVKGLVSTNLHRWGVGNDDL